MAITSDVGQRGHLSQQIDDTFSSPSAINPLFPLPNEMITEVCEHLLPRDKCDRILDLGEAQKARATFAALASTCHYLCQFGMRYLYHTYHTWLPAREHGFLSTV